MVQALFYGLKPAVFAIVIEAVIRIGRQALKNRLMVLLSGLAFVGIFFVNIPFPVIVLTAGLISYLGGKVRLEAFDVIHQREIQATDEDEAYVITDSLAQARKPSLGYAARVAIIGLLFWSLPLLVSWLWQGPEHGDHQKPGANSRVYKKDIGQL